MSLDELTKEELIEFGREQTKSAIKLFEKEKK